MRAVSLRDHEHDPVLTDVPLPEPGPNQVRVAMRACGICGTDTHIIRGALAPSFLPIVLGHEASGVIDALGEGTAADLAVGDRVTVNPMLTCGRCKQCQRGQSNYCVNIRVMGLHIDGAHSEYFVVPSSNVVALPASVGFPLGAIVADAMATPLRAITSAGIQPGATVAVFGLGGLGLHAAMILKQLYGASVVGVDATEAALDRAGGFGVDVVLDARSGRVANEIKAATGGGVDAAFEFVGSVAAVDQALRSLDYGGICTVAGLTPDRLNLSLRQETLVARGIRLAGTQGYLTSDIEQLLSWLDSGTLTVENTVSYQFDLADYTVGLDTLRERSANAIRVVITNH